MCVCKYTTTSVRLPINANVIPFYIGINGFISTDRTTNRPSDRPTDRPTVQPTLLIHIHIDERCYRATHETRFSFRSCAATHTHSHIHSQNIQPSSVNRPHTAHPKATATYSQILSLSSFSGITNIGHTEAGTASHTHSVVFFFILSIKSGRIVRRRRRPHRSHCCCCFLPTTTTVDRATYMQSSKL